MELLVKQLSRVLNRLPRLTVSRLDRSPVFNLYDDSYIQGVLFWSLLPVFCLSFWLCLYAAFGCFSCCYGSHQIVADSARARFYRRLNAIGAFVCHLVSCVATTLLVFGSERLHSTVDRILVGINEINQNFTKLNGTAFKVTDTIGRYTSENNLSEFELGSLNVLHSHSAFAFASDFVERIRPLQFGLKRTESVRWICVIVFTTTFCLLTIFLCKCCQLTARKRFSWVSRGLILLTIFVYGLLCVFYIPGTIAVSDYCVNPEQTYLSLTGNASRDYRDVFAHYYSCKSDHFKTEINDLQKLLGNVRKKAASAGGRSQRTMLDQVLTLLKLFSEQLSCINTSHTLRHNQHLLCNEACLYIIVCTIAVGGLSISIPGTSLLLKCLAQHEVFRQSISDIISIGTATTDRIRRAFRKGPSIVEPSAPPTATSQNRRAVAKHQRQRNRNFGNCRGPELAPMLAPRMNGNGKNRSPPPPYDDS